jgi:hypothetical protein
MTAAERKALKAEQQNSIDQPTIVKKHCNGFT